MNKTLFISILVSILLVMPAFAALDVQSEVVEGDIFLDEQAIYNIKLSNPDPVSKVIQIYPDDVAWYVQLEPSITKIPGNSSIDTVLYLIPNAWANTGAKMVRVFVGSSTTGEQYILQLPVYVKSFDSPQKDYSPSVELTVDFSEDADPRESLDAVVYLRNRNKLDIKEMKLVVESEMFRKENILPLGPQAETRERFSFSVDPLTPPGDHRLDVFVIVNNKTVSQERINFKIIPYAEFVAKKDTVDEVFKRSSEYVVTNKGNVELTDNFRVETSFLKKILTRTIPWADRVSVTKGGYFEWELTLQPGEETTILVIENFRPIIYFLLFVTMSAVLYFIYRSPVVARKDAIVTGSSAEGISEMKVLIHIRNRSQDLIENIVVSDMIPSLASLVKEAKLGTISPSKIIRHAKKGTIIKWELDALEPFEERIISYRLKSKITIVGGFTLPQTKVKFNTNKDRERITFSNKSQVSLGL
ncbi:hypothetical protein JXC34_02015 [Candidatus Woesearchaeota archaeon]|nr:hypothetical protein [Candidatus Woesearchaeota archaeon]